MKEDRMRLLGLDLGTKTLGVAITDKTNTLASPYTVIKFKFEDYNTALDEVLKIIKEKDISKVVLGLPKNMDGTIGFAGERSINFKKMLENKDVKVELEDERLPTKMSEAIIHDNESNIKSTKNKIDAIAATIILESFLKRYKDDFKK